MDEEHEQHVTRIARLKEIGRSTEQWNTQLDLVEKQLWDPVVAQTVPRDAEDYSDDYDNDSEDGSNLEA